MRKIILLWACLLGSFLSFAQTISFGLKGGVNLSTLSYSENSFTISTQVLTRYHVGGIIDIGFHEFSSNRQYYIAPKEVRLKLQEFTGEKHTALRVQKP